MLLVCFYYSVARYIYNYYIRLNYNIYKSLVYVIKDNDLQIGYIKA